MIEEPEESPAGAPEWMVTFADLMSLLLTFFVLLLSFSNMEIVKFQMMMGSIQNALGLKSEMEISNTPTGSELLPHMNPQDGDGETAGEEYGSAPAESDPAPAEVQEALQEILEASDLTDKGVAVQTEGGVTLQLSGDLLFESGEAAISPAALPLLDAVAEYALSVRYAVDVVGYTDDVPISTPVYPSNWELSAARAGQAVRYLSEHGVPPERMRAIGRADTNPVLPNDTADGRAANRRIEFLFGRLSDPARRQSIQELVNSSNE